MATEQFATSMADPALGVNIRPESLHKASIDSQSTDMRPDVPNVLESSLIGAASGGLHTTTTADEQTRLLQGTIDPTIPDQTKLGNDRWFVSGFSPKGQVGVPGCATAVLPICLPVRMRFAKVAVAFDHAIAVGGEEAYTWGAGMSGALGLQDCRSNVDHPTEVSGVDANVVDVAAGTNFSLLLCADGTVLACGQNDHGQLGVGSNGIMASRTFVPVPLFQHTNATNTAVEPLGRHSSNDDAACGGQSGSAPVRMTEDHMVLESLSTKARETQGAASGLGDTVTGPATDECKPAGDHANAARDDPVSAVFAGGRTAYALSRSGRVYAWGASSCGQSGTGARSDLFQPMPVGDLRAEVVTLVAAGYQHALFVTASGALFAAGSGLNGRLGLGKDTRDRASPVRILGPLEGRRVVSAAAGDGYSLAVTDTGELFAWGENQGYQLGIPPTSAETREKSERGIRPVPDGLAPSSFVPDLEAPVIAMRDIGTPTKVTGGLAGRRVVSVAAGYMHSLAVTDTGDVFVWGRQ